MQIHGIYYLTLTPRELSTGSELSAIVKQIADQGYHFIVFYVDWDDYQQYEELAGSSGIIFVTELRASVLGAGLFMRYTQKTFTKGFRWIDTWDHYTGIYDL
jgi:hypothetical protein